LRSSNFLLNNNPRLFPLQHRSPSRYWLFLVWADLSEMRVRRGALPVVHHPESGDRVTPAATIQALAPSSGTTTAKVLLATLTSTALHVRATAHSPTRRHIPVRRFPLVPFFLRV
jgi:hypothetical protein